MLRTSNGRCWPSELPFSSLRSTCNMRRVTSDGLPSRTRILSCHHPPQDR
jgi:hypothetical protein